MKHPDVPPLKDAYPRLFSSNGFPPLMSDKDLERAQTFLTGEETDRLAKGGFKKDIVTAELGRQTFHALFSQGEDKHTVIVPAEYATGMGVVDDRDAVMRAYAMRDLINPRASLLYFPNNVYDENNLDLSRQEQGILEGTRAKAGDFKPLTDRIITLLQQQGVEDDALTGVGNSQGAAVIASLAARSDVEMHSLATFLPPDVVSRTKFQLAKDFLKPLKNNLFENIEISKLGTDVTFLDQGYLDLVNFAHSAFDRGNRATTGPISAGKHEELLRAALGNTPGLTVVRGWTPHAPISPAHINRKIGDRLKGEFNSRVENHLFSGNYADATSANAWPIVSSLAKRAYIMANHLS